MKPRKSLARQAAEMIAAELFSWGPIKCRRLVMDIGQTPSISGPGWCEAAVADRIEEALLRKHLEIWINTKKKPLTK